MTVFRTICIFVCLMTMAILAQGLAVSPASRNRPDTPLSPRPGPHPALFLGPAANSRHKGPETKKGGKISPDASAWRGYRSTAPGSRKAAAARVLRLHAGPGDRLCHQCAQEPAPVGTGKRWLTSANIAATCGSSAATARSIANASQPRKQKKPPLVVPVLRNRVFVFCPIIAKIPDPGFAKDSANRYITLDGDCSTRNGRRNKSV